MKRSCPFPLAVVACPPLGPLVSQAGTAAAGPLQQRVLEESKRFWDASLTSWAVASLSLRQQVLDAGAAVSNKVERGLAAAAELADRTRHAEMQAGHVAHLCTPFLSFRPGRTRKMKVANS